MSSGGAEKPKAAWESEVCADCGSNEIEDTWVVCNELTQETTEEPLCAECSKQRELEHFGPEGAGPQNWLH